MRFGIALASSQSAMIYDNLSNESQELVLIKGINDLRASEAAFLQTFSRAAIAGDAPLTQLELELKAINRKLAALEQIVDEFQVHPTAA